MARYRLPRTVQEQVMSNVVQDEPHLEESAASTEERRCWICFGDASDSQGKWVKPCQCSLEAHQKCLLEWIAEKQKGSSLKKVQCPQCSDYYYLSQDNSVHLALFNLLDTLIRTGAPYIAALGLGGSFLISCTTYGAFTIMTLFGAKDGERLIGNPALWTWKTWTGLPMIPILLLASETRWGDFVLPVAAVTTLRATGVSPNKIKLTWPISPALTIGLMPWVSFFYNNAYRLARHYILKSLSIPDGPIRRSETNNEHNVERNIMYGIGSRTISGSIMGTLLWPITSSVIGSLLHKFKWVQQNFPDTFQRNILGGYLFVMVKDISNLWYRYEKVRQYRSRRVMSYKEIKKA